jgi:hypothetical protein
MDISNVNSIEELLGLWRSYGYEVEYVVVHTGRESVYYMMMTSVRFHYASHYKSLQTN